MAKRVFDVVDGCRAGWFAVFLEEKRKNDWKFPSLI